MSPPQENVNLSYIQVDWNEVAGNLGISNGHAARMRYSRFKQQMEGIHPPPRKPRKVAVQKKPAKEKPKPKSTSKLKPEERLKRENSEETKEEPGQLIPGLSEQAPAEQPTRIKDEPLENSDHGNFGDMEWIELHNDAVKDLIVPKLEDFGSTPAEVLQAIKQEPRVKVEPMWDWRKDWTIGFQLRKLHICEKFSKIFHILP